MLEMNCDLWDCRRYAISPECHKYNHYVAITTNGYVKKDGKLVMGRGCALEASKKFPELAEHLGNLILKGGNQPYVVPHLRLVTFPVKVHWADTADLALIDESARLLKDVMNVYSMGRVYLPRPGCGYGLRTWGEVKPILEKHFGDNDRLVVVHYEATVSSPPST